MTIMEAAKQLSISADNVNRYISIGILEADKSVCDNDIHTLSLAETLTDFGFTALEIADYLNYEKNQRYKQQQILLHSKRHAMLNAIHKTENRLVQLDYLINEKQKKIDAQLKENNL